MNARKHMGQAKRPFVVLFAIDFKISGKLWFNNFMILCSVFGLFELGGNNIEK